MKTKIKNAQTELNGIFTGKLAVLGNVGKFMIFAYVAVLLLQMILPNAAFFNFIFNILTPISYAVTLVGIFICFSKFNTNIIAIYFGARGVIQFLNIIIILFRMISGSYSFSIYNVSNILNGGLWMIMFLALAVGAFMIKNDLKLTNNALPSKTATAPQLPKSEPVTGNKCKNCGNELKNGATFCGVCGTKAE